MVKGYNLAEQQNINFSKSLSSAAICIFISHSRVDKPFAITVGEYLMNAGYNIYLDIKDEELQKAVDAKDALKITTCIEKGINSSTHLMCIVSESTVKSWWVPYEIGYSKKCGKSIATLTHKNTITIPEYLQIGQLIRGIRGLNQYIESMKSDIMKSYKLPVNILSEYTFGHPLEGHLDKYK